MEDIVLTFELGEAMLLFTALLNERDDMRAQTGPDGEIEYVSGRGTYTEAEAHDLNALTNKVKLAIIDSAP